MVPWTLAYAAISALTATGVYVLVARTLMARKTSKPVRLAAGSLVAWWFGLAASTAIGGLRLFLGMIGNTDVALFTAIAQFNVLVLCAALGSLLYHLLYLYTGKEELWRPIVAFYVAYAFILLYYLAQIPVGNVEVDRWSVRTRSSAEPGSSLFLHVLIFLLVVPQILAAFAYFLLIFRVSQRILRFRIAVVSSSIMLWFSSTYLAILVHASGTDLWQVTSRLIGLVAAAAILTAYRPPSWIRRRLVDEPQSAETSESAFNVANRT